MPTMNLKETFKKQGGVKLLKQYWKSGALFTAMVEFLLLGKSRTALEILRLSASFKTKRKLERKYRKELLKFDCQWKAENFDHSLKHDSSKRVWIFWFQGMENAPALVQKCYQSVKKNMSDREVVLITSENMMDYVTFPDYIQKKIDRGIIKGAHLSDLLRLELLLKYGGTWMDATVYCSRNIIPSYMLNSDLFLFQNLKPGRDGHTAVISNWFITAMSNNKILAAVQHLLYCYWKDDDDLMDYFIFHDFFQIVIEKYPDEWDKVVPFSNSTPHIILLRLFEQYDDTMWNAVIAQTPFHKLSYKFDDKKSLELGTYYEHIMKS